MAFFISFWAINFEPSTVIVNGEMVSYHDMCDDLNQCCKYCLFWFLFLGFALTCALHALSVFAEEHEPKIHLGMKLCVWLSMNWFINLLLMVRNIEVNTKDVTGAEVLFTLGCFIIFGYKYRKLKSELRNSDSYKPK